MSNILSKSNPPEGFVVSADYQSEGVGQVGRKWESTPAENILMSIYLTPSFLHITNVFYLNIIVSLALANVLSHYIDEEHIKIKWPNDLYIRDKKIAGILIKNTLHKNIIIKSIIGVGLNVFQKSFKIENATSLSLSKVRDLDISEIKQHLFFALEQYYLILRSKNIKQLMDQYQSLLYRKDIVSNYLDLKTNDLFSGTIKSISSDGKLVIETKGVIKEYALHEIIYI